MRIGAWSSIQQQGKGCEGKKEKGTLCKRAEAREELLGEVSPLVYGLSRGISLMGVSELCRMERSLI